MGLLTGWHLILLVFSTYHPGGMALSTTDFGTQKECQAAGAVAAGEFTAESTRPVRPDDDGLWIQRGEYTSARFVCVPYTRPAP